MTIQDGMDSPENLNNASEAPSDEESSSVDAPDVTADENGAATAAADEESGEPDLSDGGSQEESEVAEVVDLVDPLEEARAEAGRLRDQLLRTAADFDNFRKRSRREAEEAERRGREETLRGLLPVFDNLERASAHAETASDVNSLADGIAMVRRQFLDTLGKLGVERIEALGAPFDPAVHEAIQQVETDEFEPGTVANEFQPGYRMGERLVRPAMVVVAKKPVAAED